MPMWRAACSLSALTQKAAGPWEPGVTGLWVDWRMKLVGVCRNLGGSCLRGWSKPGDFPTLLVLPRVWREERPMLAC